MVEQAKIHNPASSETRAGESRFHTILKRTVLRPACCTVLASLGIFGGISALFVGLVFVVLHEIITSDRVFDSVGSGLLIAAIPMILLGSFFLDEINGHK